MDDGGRDSGKREGVRQHLVARLLGGLGVGVQSDNRVRRDYFPEMCSGSEAGSYLWRIDFVCHSTLGVRVIKKKKKLSHRCKSANSSRSNQKGGVRKHLVARLVEVWGSGFGFRLNGSG